MEPGIFTIGHSTHPVDEFVGLLRRHRVAALVHVRRFPVRVATHSSVQRTSRQRCRLPEFAIPISLSLVVGGARSPIL